MASLCDEIRSALSGFNVCSETPDGARIATHCLYPSHEFVHVYVVNEGGGFAFTMAAEPIKRLGRTVGMRRPSSGL